MIRITPARGVILSLTIAMVALALLATSQLASAHRPGNRDSLADVRAATVGYHDLAVAEADGYTLLTDTAGITCIDNPGVGAMGIHHANGALVGVRAIDAHRPQVLVYEPMGGEPPSGGGRVRGSPGGMGCGSQCAADPLWPGIYADAGRESLWVARLLLACLGLEAQAERSLLYVEPARSLPLVTRSGWVRKCSRRPAFSAHPCAFRAQRYV
jgi:hypothetical protein